MPPRPAEVKKFPIKRPPHQSWVASVLREWSVRVCQGLTHLSNDAVLAGRWARWRSVLLVATVRGLRALKLDTILLAVVALVRAVTIVAVVGVVCRSRVWRCRSAVVVVVVVVVVGLRVGGGVVIARSCGPAGAVEGRATSLAPAASGDTTVDCQYKLRVVAIRKLTCRRRTGVQSQLRRQREQPIAPTSSRRTGDSIFVVHSGHSST